MADSNLQQYNGTPIFPSTADVNTNADPYLLPTDGPVVTADSNPLGYAPVNKGLKKMRDWVVGLRGALVGDFAGAVQKSVKSFYADLTGGATHTKPAGTITASGPAAPGVAIEAETGDIQATDGDILALTGKIRALVDYIQSVTNGFISGDLSIPAYAGLDRGILRFIGTVSAGSNPAATTAMKNQLRALNIPKAWVSFTTNGAVGTACIVSDGQGIASVVRTTTYFTVTFAAAFDSAEYAVTYSLTDYPQHWIGVTNKLAGSCDVVVFDTVGILDPVNIDTTKRVDLHFHGRQTT